MHSSYPMHRGMAESIHGGLRRLANGGVAYFNERVFGCGWTATCGDRLYTLEIGTDLS